MISPHAIDAAVPCLITHNVVAMRSKPHAEAEQVSQAILGDRIEALETHEDYARIRTGDGYEGWALRRHFRKAIPGEPLLDAPSSAHASRIRRVLSPFASLLSSPRKETPMTRLVIGTRVEVEGGAAEQKTVESGLTVNDTVDPALARVKLAGGESGFLPVDALEPTPTPSYSLSTVCDFAQSWIGTPYLWGGSTPFGFDCSGMTQRAYSMVGILLPRDAYLQAQCPLGQFSAPGQALRPGDLVFFLGPRDPRSRGITHVGMALDNHEFIHAVGRDGVSIARFDDPYYSHFYSVRGSWRYSPPA